MTNYKILTVTPHLPPDSGGIANHVFNLNINLVKQNRYYILIIIRFWFIENKYLFSRNCFDIIIFIIVRKRY